MKLPDIFKKNRKKAEPHCSAVILAAGSSTRMGSDKLMMNLGETPVLARTLKAFERSPLVDEIVVVTKMDQLQETADLCKKFGIEKVKRVIAGGVHYPEQDRINLINCGALRLSGEAEAGKDQRQDQEQ